MYNMGLFCTEFGVSAFAGLDKNLLNNEIPHFHSFPVPLIYFFLLFLSDPVSLKTRYLHSRPSGLFILNSLPSPALEGPTERTSSKLAPRHEHESFAPQQQPWRNPEHLPLVTPAMSLMPIRSIDYLSIFEKESQ